MAGLEPLKPVIPGFAGWCTALPDRYLVSGKGRRAMGFEIDGFATEGFVVAPVFGRDEVEALRDVVAGHMDRLAKALTLPYAETSPEAPYDHRIEEIANRDPSYAQLIGSAVATDAHHDRRVTTIAEDDRLARLAERLIGAPITGRTIRFRGNSSAMSQHRQHWHSDVALADGSSCSTVRLTCWIPFVDAGPDNGGLEIAAGRRNAPLPHNPSPGRFHIDDAAVADAPKATPVVPVGSVLLIDRFTPHRALRNTSGRTRWSLVVWMKA